MSKEDLIKIIPASPKVRKFARELGVDINKVKGSERDGRVIEEDIKLFVSRNDGANWEETVLAYEGMYNDTYQIISGTGAVGTHDLDLVTDFEGVSGIPVMRWKIQTYNNKYQKVKGVAQLWS